MIGRLLALLICIAALVGIGIEFAALVGDGASPTDALWRLAGYFTILTNALLAILFGGIALGRRGFDRPSLVAGATAAIALVGVVFALLLRGMRALAGETALANFLLHELTPVLAVLFWLAFARKGLLSWRDPLLWALYPLAYLAYALARGMVEGRYAYPFIDLATLGWANVLLNSVVIGVAFIGFGELLVVIDRALGRWRARKA